MPPGRNKIYRKKKNPFHVGCVLCLFVLLFLFSKHLPSPSLFVSFLSNEKQVGTRLCDRPQGQCADKTDRDLPLVALFSDFA